MPTSSGPSEISTYGFDPGLRNGALVYATFRIDDSRHTLANFRIIHSWKTKDEDHLSKQATPIEIARFANDRLLSKMTYPAHMCGVEWEPNSVYWRAQKLQVVTTGLLVGYILRGTQLQGLPQAFFTPAQVKKAFGISPREGKEYQKRAVEMVGYPTLTYASDDSVMGWLSSRDPDVFDALLIAYLAAVVLRGTA